MEMFGPTVPDVIILRNLELIDGRIDAGIGKVKKLIADVSLAASQGAPLPPNKMKAIDALRAWIYERGNNAQSIYSCYR
jgi:hypothetical protein